MNEAHTQLLLHQSAQFKGEPFIKKQQSYGTGK